MNIDVKVNPVYIPYMNEDAETQIYFGGSSSGKSYWAAQRIVIDVMDGVNWMCCRNVAKTIRRSIFNEITKAILTIGVSRFFSINKTDMVITCLLNNKQIIFCGLDDPEKVKSVTPINGVLERILIEEATEVKKSAYKQLKKRLRGISDKKKFIMMLFNPILKSHWIYEEFFGQWNDEGTVLRADRLLILKTTYKDNIFLTKDDVASLENESDPYFYNVYTLGNWGVLGHVIFKNWHTADLGEMRKSFDNTSIMEPQYAIRYYTYTDINGVKRCKAYFYDAEHRYEYDGTYGALKATGSVEPHLFDYCPLMGIPINEDMLGYCEKVLSLIDDYDKCMSDVSNDLEAFANAHMVFENVGDAPSVLKEAQHSAVIAFPPAGSHPGSVHYLTKEMDIAANNSHLDRLEKNIYRFTHTPNLDDQRMGESSGQALKHRLLGLETKCGIIQAKMESAIMYMWKVLSSAWAKKKIVVDPIQCTCAFKRNFPLDVASSVESFVALKNAGYPLKECVEITLPWVEDADYIVSLMEEAMYSIPPLDAQTEGDDDADTADGA